MTAQKTSTGQATTIQAFSGVVTLIPAIIGGRFEGDVYKVERVAYRGDESGVREHLWFLPDPRPHNHPWADIACKVVDGAYRVVEYVPNGDSYRKREFIIRAGDPEHIVSHDVYHEVVEVVPGTFSVMAFGRVVGNAKNWGHLRVNADGSYSHEAPSSDPMFLDALRHLNPHMRPDGWEDPYAHLPHATLEMLLQRLQTIAA